MNVFDEVLENRFVKYLSLSILVLPFILDALSDKIYFYGASAFAAFLLVLAFVDVMKKKKLYETEVLTIPIVVGFEPNVSTKYTLKKLFDTLEEEGSLKDLKKNLKKYRDITEEELVFEYKGDLYNKDSLISFMQIIRYQITKIKQENPSCVQFHLLNYTRPSYGFWLGYVFANEDVVVYQQNPDKDSFEHIAHLKDRNYKNEIRSFEKFHVETLKEDTNSDTVLFGIKASSHHISFNNEELSKYTNVVYMVANHKGTIEPDENWVLYAREIFTQLMQLQNSYKNIVIAHNMPESLAFIVGMAAGNFWPVMITQYERGEYKEIMKLNDLKCYF